MKMPMESVICCYDR